MLGTTPLLSVSMVPLMRRDQSAQFVMSCAHTTTSRVVAIKASTYSFLPSAVVLLPSSMPCPAEPPESQWEDAIDFPPSSGRGGGENFLGMERERKRAGWCCGCFPDQPALAETRKNWTFLLLLLPRTLVVLFLVPNAVSHSRKRVGGWMGPEECIVFRQTPTP